MKGFVLINEGTDPTLTRDRVIAAAGVFARQQVELAQWWQRNPLSVLQADTEAAAPQEDGWTLVKSVDTLDDADALAEHTVTAQGRPLILVGLHIIRANAPAGSDWIAGPDSWTTAASHELCETPMNPYVDFYSPFDANTWIPLECCDPVQGDSYELDAGSGIYVSNFVGPRYFSDSAGPYDRMGLVKSPREIRPGGYLQKLVGGPAGSSSAVFGALPHEGGMPEWKRVAKAKAGTRFAAIAAKATGTDVTAELAELREAFAVSGKRWQEELGALAKGHADQLGDVRAAVDEERRHWGALLDRAKTEGGRRGNGGIGG